jgi:SNF2 family DNA or RNA helicase
VKQARTRVGQRAGHQQAGDLCWLHPGVGCILADIVGFGKTFTAQAVIKYLDDA